MGLYKSHGNGLLWSLIDTSALSGHPSQHLAWVNIYGKGHGLPNGQQSLSLSSRRSGTTSVICTGSAATRGPQVSTQEISAKWLKTDGLSPLPDAEPRAGRGMVSPLGSDKCHLQGDGGLSLPEELHWQRRGQHPQLFYGQRALG